MSERRLKGDENYPQCPVCHKPIREDDSSISLTVASGQEGPPLHNECFHRRTQDMKRNPDKYFPSRKGGNKVTKGGVQTVMTDTGEIVDEPDMKTIETTLKSFKTFLIGDKKLGDEFVVAVHCQVIEVGTELVKGKVVNVQKVEVKSIQEKAA